MIYSNKKSKNKILHTENCPYIRNKTGGLLRFHDLQEPQRKGFCLCKKCNPLHAKWTKEQDALRAYAEEKNLTLHYEGSCLHVICGDERWKIVVEKLGTGIALYHKNTTEYYTDSYVPFYHRQSVTCGKLIHLLRYVYAHSLYRKKNPIAGNKRRAPKRRQKKEKRAVCREEKNSRILSLLQSLHKESVYQDFLCYLT